MILGGNPTGHGFVLRDLVLIELSGHALPHPAWGRGGRGGGGGARNFEVKIKMHNTSIKSIFGNLIYFRDI